MTQTRAIILAGGMIAASVLAHLAYTVNHDRQLAKAAEQNDRLTQQNQAWGTAKEHVASDFKRWLEALAKPDRSHYIEIKFAWVKDYERSDITWNDDRHVTVQGYLYATFPKGDEHGFLWTQDLVLGDSGIWGAQGYVTFIPKELPKAKIDSMRVKPIIY